MDNNFSTIKLESIPETLELHTNSVSSVLSHVSSCCNDIGSIVNGDLSSQWYDVASNYAKVSQKITDIVNEICNGLYTYINETMSNENVFVNEIEELNNMLANMSKRIENIKL